MKRFKVISANLHVLKPNAKYRTTELRSDHVSFSLSSIMFHELQIRAISNDDPRKIQNWVAVTSCNVLVYILGLSFAIL